MCVVSNIGDSYRDSFPERWPNVYPSINPFPIVREEKIVIQPEVSKHEFEALKKEVEELKKLLLAAKEYDKNTGQPDCQMDDKVKFLKQVADFVGVDLKEIFSK